jgi:chaperonin cofactor prefoldin
MEKRAENAIVNALGELGVKLDKIETAVVNLDKRILHLDERVENLDRRIENLDNRLIAVEKNTGDLNYKFDRIYDLLKGNLDVLPRIVLLEKAVFNK